MSARPSEADHDDSNLSDIVAPHLPYLRRYARALCGEQGAGDAFVASALEAMIADRGAIDLSLPPRVALYRLFHAIWSSAQVSELEGPATESDPVSPSRIKIARLTPRSRQALLLTTVEEFGFQDAGRVMDVAPAEVKMLLDEARRELGREVSARVMIIEDEPIIALDLESIVSSMGHRVAGVADTHDRAVALAGAETPDLILADIQLADGSSGIDAVEDILANTVTPVIFVTAYPERLLTGARAEPTFLVTKPFKTETVEAAISQVLFLNAPG